MKSDDERQAELEHVEADLRSRLLLRRPSTGIPLYDAEQSAKLVQAIARCHTEITAIEHLRLQRAKVKAPPDPLEHLTPAELSERIDRTQAELEKMRAKLPKLKAVK